MKTVTVEKAEATNTDSANDFKFRTSKCIAYMGRLVDGYLERLATEEKIRVLSRIIP